MVTMNVSSPVPVVALIWNRNVSSALSPAGIVKFCVSEAASSSSRPPNHAQKSPSYGATLVSSLQSASQMGVPKVDDCSSQSSLGVPASKPGSSTRFAEQSPEGPVVVSSTA